MMRSTRRTLSGQRKRGSSLAHDLNDVRKEHVTVLAEIRRVVLRAIPRQPRSEIHHCEVRAEAREESGKHRFLAERDAVTLLELLARQCRTKVGPK